MEVFVGNVQGMTGPKEVTERSCSNLQENKDFGLNELI